MQRPEMNGRGDVRVLTGNARIAFLEKELANLVAMKDALYEQLQEAYARISELEAAE